MRRAYREAGLEKNRDLFERVVMHAGPHRQPIDFAVANGRAVQLTQTWSFRLADHDQLAESVRAWGWTVNEARENGATIEVDGRAVEVPRDVLVAVVLIPPTEPRDAETLGDIRAVFSKVEAEQVDVDHAGEVANAALARLREGSPA